MFTGNISQSGNKENHLIIYLLTIYSWCSTPIEGSWTSRDNHNIVKWPRSHSRNSV